jgi:hypothetical protein
VRRALIVLSLLSVLAPAHAQQTASPVVTTLALPLTVRTTLERDTSHGCSQSFESVSARGTVLLEIDPSGATRLTFDGRYFRNSGPSFGRFQAGDHGFSQLTELHHTTWSGRASTLPEGITITFDHVEAAEARFTGYGTMPLPAATSEAFAGQMHCAIARTEVFPAVEADAEQPTATPLLACSWVGSSPAPFDSYAEEGASFQLGAGPGVRVTTTSSMWSSRAEHRVRFTP